MPEATSGSTEQIVVRSEVRDCVAGHFEPSSVAVHCALSDGGVLSLRTCLVERYSSQASIFFWSQVCKQALPARRLFTAPWHTDHRLTYKEGGAMLGTAPIYH
jgi:hypothetical protein